MYHEVGTDDGSLPNPQPIEAYIESADFDIGDGHDFGFVWRLLPDLTFAGSNGTGPHIELEMQARTNSGSAYRTKTPPTVTRTVTIPIEEYTGQVYIRLRGRQMKLKVASYETGIAWQLGQTRIDIRPDGRKI